MIVTIDGPAGAGKSTIAKKLAEILGFSYFDTGAMYRAITYFVLQHGIDVRDEKGIVKLLLKFHFSIHGKERRYFIDEEEVTALIRSPEVTKFVSIVSAYRSVREALVKMQRRYAKRGNWVFEGRDIGTVVFPTAKIKLFFTASSEERAKRRIKDFEEKYPDKTFALEEIQREIEKRDEIDSTREFSPLKCPIDAIVIDTSTLTIEEVLRVVLEKTKLSFLRPKMKLFYHMVILFVGGVFKLLYRHKVYGIEHFIHGSALVAANHVSNLDPPALSASCPEEMHFLAKSSLFHKPLLGRFIKKLNTHPIGRASDAKTFKMIAKLTKEGKKVLIFPEGRRSYSNKLGKILPGLGFLAYLTSVPIIPAYIHGTYEIWKRGKKLPRFFGRTMCVFGSPILPSLWKNLPKQEAIEVIVKQFVSSIEKLETWVKEGCIGNPP